mgnify:CR=1 FL=1|jgi:hypothetical protein
MSPEYFYVGESHEIKRDTFEKFIVRVYKAQNTDDYKLVFIKDTDQKILDTVYLDGESYEIYARSKL